MVRVLTVQGAISPASADYLLRGIAKAIEEQAHLMVIEMDTPGGLDTSMRDIIKAILASPVPVATYVSPKGARAASAGTYILYASHIAAMAPAPTSARRRRSSNSPAFRRRQACPDKPAAPGKPDAGKPAEPAPGDPKMRKAVHDAAAYIRGLAELARTQYRVGRARGARSGQPVGAEALATECDRLVATDLDDLLQQVDGRAIEMNGQTVTLDTSNAVIEKSSPTGAAACWR
jgi:membrane-bound serine protease (ClpP class)